MPAEPELHALTNALQPVRRAWVQAAGRVLASTGLSTPIATAVLLTSRLGPDVQQKKLALEMGVNPAALVRTLDQGEAAGLLVRSGVKEDRRSKVVNLLPEGKLRAEQVERMLAELRQHLLGDLATEELYTATRVLRLLEERVAIWLQGDGAR